MVAVPASLMCNSHAQLGKELWTVAIIYLSCVTLTYCILMELIGSWKQCEAFSPGGPLCGAPPLLIPYPCHHLEGTNVSPSITH